MPINLADHERGAPFTGDKQAALNALQDRLARLQLMQKVHRRRMIVIVEGWMGNGRAALKHLSGAWDPCYARTHCTDPISDKDDERHWLAPFWGALPAAGETTIFFRSWYVRMVLERSFGGADTKRFARMCDEVNEFESQQHDHGTLIVKLFFHLSAERSAGRLNEMKADPWHQHLVTRGDHVSIEKRDSFNSAIGEMFDQTDTRWAPWQVIDANNEDSGVLAALALVADSMQKNLPADPPVEGETVVPFRSQKIG